ncbi:NFACT RNA binding domain-containing protein [Companilactobacillus heilongjiangensis]|uniref:RNA-binding protein n=1 Tax=Companilactobacillus heilongjiangensis TaxID=1074467 RepID=A0A0K2L9H2_9LACO|nr:NFACT RNA binding domain-containing protein [Companilactobacillus heilongjiangensis]ALB27915.1 RNA-binding protein [Companilactobacillus heilongjiangensis]
MSTEQESTATEVIEAMAWQIDHTKKQITSLKKAIKKVGDAKILQVKGTLLKTYVNQIDEQKGYVVLPDYSHSDKDITIYLDTDKSVMENAEEYFHQYHRDKRGLETIKNNLSKAETALQQELQRQHSFDAEDTEQAKLVKQQLIDEDAIKTKVLHSSKAPEPAHPRRFYTTDNVLVEVGKNSVQNDHLTLTAKKDYYWMHVSELAGSHVVVHSVNPSEQTLLEAASLAAYYSKGRGLKQVPVDVLKVRQLHKPKGAKPGLVLFTGKADTLTVYPDGEMAEKLAEKNS